jgi:hypothetical protein
MKQILNIFSVPKIRRLHEQYETHFSALALTAGLAVDSLTLRRIDLWAENLAILGFLFIASLAIVLMQLYNTGWLRKLTVLSYRPFAHANWWLPLVIQFAFGGLFSVFVVFYGRSGSIVANWPFFLILVGLLVGNEIVRTYYRKFFFNTIVFYIAVFAYAIFAVPILVGQVTTWVFLISGVVSLAVISLFIKLLQRISPVSVKARKQGWVYAIGGIFLVLNVLYFFSIMPPIPLSLQDAQIAQRVERLPDNTYQVTHEARPWYQTVFADPTVHMPSGGSVYFYSSVFAPTDLSTDVIHHWQYNDEGSWRTASRIRFSVIGGRQGGYRGYSKKQNIFPGKWRVTTLIEDGRVLGQTTFNISFEDSDQPLTTSTY